MANLPGLSMSPKINPREDILSSYRNSNPKSLNQKVIRAIPTSTRIKHKKELSLGHLAPYGGSVFHNRSSSTKQAPSGEQNPSNQTPDNKTIANSSIKSKIERDKETKAELERLEMLSDLAKNSPSKKTATQSGVDNGKSIPPPQRPVKGGYDLNEGLRFTIDDFIERLGKISNVRNPLPNFEATKGSEKSYGIIKGFGVCTNQGLVRNYNEDRVSIVLNIQRPQSYSKNEYWPNCCFFGVYDGHGGTRCAEFLRNKLHQYLVQSPHFPLRPHEAINEAVEKCEKEFLEFVQKDAAWKEPTDRSGSCGLIALFVDDMLYIGNIGDSRAIISQELGRNRFALTRDHKPSDPQEKKRILQAGGKVYQNLPLGPNGKRLDLDKSSNPFGIVIPYRVAPGGLSVSRTIGDAEAKVARFGGNRKVVISCPEITTLKLTAEHDFLIIGSDGIYDKTTNNSLIESVWTSLKSKQTTNLHEFCKIGVESVIREALVKRSTDNVTAILIVFESIEKMVAEQNYKNLDKTIDLKSEMLFDRTPTENQGNERASLPAAIEEQKSINGNTNMVAKKNEGRAIKTPPLKLPDEISSNTLLPSIVRHKTQPLIQVPNFQRKSSFHETPKITKMI